MWFNKLLKSWNRPARSSVAVARAARRWPAAFRPRVEQLMDRIAPAVTFTFDGDLLTVTSDNASDVINVFSLAATGAVSVNNQATGATLFTLDQLVINGNGGNDTINLASLNSEFLDGPAEVNGGDGNDTITGSLASDIITGGTGNDNIDGGPGNDLLDGGLGNDTVRGNTGTDTLFGGEEANDADVILESGDADFILNNTTLESFPGQDGQNPFGIDSIAGFERAILIGGNGGNFLGAEAFAGPVTLRGGGGNDGLSGSEFNDVLEGGDGNDLLDGNGGTDTVVAEAFSATSFVLTNSQLIVPHALFAPDGLGTDSLFSIEQASLVGGAGNDTFDVGGFGGASTLVGGDGTDRLVSTVPLDASLNAANLFVRTGQGAALLSFVEQAVLTGNDGRNVINAAAFLGSVTLFGAGGNDVLTGGIGNDRLDGGFGDDTLTGGLGADVIDGGGGPIGGDDKFVETVGVNAFLDNTSFTGAGPGDDVLAWIERAEITGDLSANFLSAVGFSGPVTLNGGGGNDNLIGGSNSDVLNGGSENDTLDGNGGVDVLNGGSGIDTVNEKGNTDFTLTNSSLAAGFLSGLGTDILIDIERAELTGGSGANTLNASAFTLGSVTLNGGSGNDTLRGGSGADVLTGGTGSDNLDGGTGSDTIKEVFGIPGTVASLSNSLLIVTAVGITEFDTLNRVNAADIAVLFGSNTVNAAAFTGPVTLTGGSGADSLFGGTANDVLNGNAGDDTLQGGAGADLLNGGDNNDALFGNRIGDFTDGAIDTLNGDAGNDSLAATDPGDINNEGTGTGGIVVQGTDGDDVITVRRRVSPSGPEAVIVINGVESAVSYINGETIQVYAGKGNDIVVMDESTAVTWSSHLYGQQGRDLLVGASRGDYLDGGDGSDTLMGHAGDDTLVGGAGSDEIHGGAGADIVQAVGGGGDLIYADVFDLVAKDKDKHDHLIFE